MRVTNNMIANNTVFNMQRSISRLLDLQVQLSTGRQINKPSDDPIGVQRDLNYRTELAKNAQYQNNNQQALTWMQNYDSSLSDLKDLYSNANEIAIAMANGTYDDITREGSAEEIASILEQMVQLANNEQEGRFIYSGYRTDQKPLILSSNGVVYKGDQGQIDYQIEAKSRMTVNLSGSDVFLKPLSVLGEKSDLNAAVTNNTLLADLHGGEGIDLASGTFTFINENLGINATIDISGATTVGDLFDPATGINAQLAAAGITNVEIKLGEEGNNLLVDTTKSGLISNVTSIDKLNDGNGIDMENGKFVVSDGASISVEIDLSGAANVGEIITAFNSQMTSAGYPAVTMSLNAAGTGLQIDDAGGTPGLRIEDSSVLSTTAIDLGIVGLIGTGLTGKNLDPIESFKIDDTTGTTAADLGINGSVSVDYSGNDLDPILLASSNLADLNNGMGFDLGRIVVHHGDDTVSFDLSSPSIVTIQDVLDKINGSGLDITASLNASSTGIQIENNDPTVSLIIENDTGSELAKDLGIWGSTDLMGSMILLQKSLLNNDQDGTGRLLENLDAGIQHLLNLRASVGAKAVRLETTASRLIDMELSFTKLLSDTEDADITKLATDLASQESNYQASLAASARIIQPSLLDFLS